MISSFTLSLKVIPSFFAELLIIPTFSFPHCNTFLPQRDVPLHIYQKIIPLARALIISPLCIILSLKKGWLPLHQWTVLHFLLSYDWEGSHWVSHTWSFKVTQKPHQDAKLLLSLLDITAYLILLLQSSLNYKVMYEKETNNGIWVKCMTKEYTMASLCKFIQLDATIISSFTKAVSSH